MATTTEIAQLHTLVDEVGNTPTDELLSLYLDNATEIILNRAFPFGTDLTDVPTRYKGLKLDVAVCLYNKHGAEGELVHNENGINRTYSGADLPKELLTRIIPIAGVR